LDDHARTAATIISVGVFDTLGITLS